MWALENGVTLALANKESLVAAGSLALSARERGGGALIPVDSEHSALFQCALAGEPEAIVLTASGGPFRGRTREELADVTPADALAHPTWNMGAKITIDSATLANKGLEVIEAHFLFGLPYGRIEVVVHPTSIVHGLVRFRDGAAVAHLGYPDMRVPISYALTYPDRAATSIPPLDLTAGPSSSSSPTTETFPLLALAREAGERGGTYPCVFNAANEVAVAAFLDGRIGFLEIASRVEDALARADEPRRVISTSCERPTAERARRWRPYGGVVAAIVGLALLILIHEAGHFFAARAVGMTPRKFYLGFGPPLAKVRRGKVEYGIGSLPLGGYVKIPGMSRPSPGDLKRLIGPTEAMRYTAELRASTRRSRARTGAARARSSGSFGPGSAWCAASTTSRGRWSRTRTGGRRRGAVSSRSGPAPGSTSSSPSSCSWRSSCSRRRAARTSSRASRPGSPAAAAGLRAGDKIVSVAGTRVKADDIAHAIRGTTGRQFRLVVDRHGKRIVIGPTHARLSDGVYRIGIAIEGRAGPGESPPAAAKDALSLSWSVTADTARGLGRLLTGRDTNHVSSSVGIVKAQSAAWRQGLRDFLSVLGLISLALALMNLIPVLPLDGGHIVLALVEKLRGRTFAQSVYIRYSVVGLTLFARPHVLRPAERPLRVRRLDPRIPRCGPSGAGRRSTEKRR